MSRRRQKFKKPAIHPSGSEILADASRMGRLIRATDDCSKLLDQGVIWVVHRPFQVILIIRAFRMCVELNVPTLPIHTHVPELEIIVLIRSRHPPGRMALPFHSRSAFLAADGRPLLGFLRSVMAVLLAGFLCGWGIMPVQPTLTTQVVGVVSIGCTLPAHACLCIRLLPI